jgi:hypothetical protein
MVVLESLQAHALKQLVPNFADERNGRMVIMNRCRQKVGWFFEFQVPSFIGSSIYNP